MATGEWLLRRKVMAEEFKYNPYEGMNTAQKAMMILSQGAAAFGEGLTGRPFLTNIQRMQEGNAQRAFEQWKERQGSVQNQEMLANLTSGLGTNQGNIGLTGYTVNPATGNINLTYGQTPEAKAQEEARTAALKESMTNLGKAERLETIGKTVKDQWLATSPYKGLVTKTGLVPALGAWDVLKKGVGATDAQRRDQAYSSFVQGIRAQLARGMGDVGNLSEYEQRAVIQLIPNLMDSYESGILKLSQLSKLVSDIRDSRKSIISGNNNQTFVVNGKTYSIPADKVEAFKKAKGL